MNRALLSALMIFALVSAMISPACAFVSGGKTLIEICAADGSFKTIAVDDDQSPITTQTSHDKPQNHTHAVQSDCAFCFATANSKPLTAQTLTLGLPLLSASYIKSGAGQIIPLSAATLTYNSRAPPALIA